MVNVVAVKEWAAWIIQNFFHPTAVVVAPILLFCLMVVLLFQAFRDGIVSGVRSISGILLPVVVLTFLFRYQADMLRNLIQVPAIAVFGAAMAVGAVIMTVIRLVARAFGIPFAEILVSGNLTFLAFGYLSLHQGWVLAACYGMFAGILLYVIVLGFPFASHRHKEEPVPG